MITALMIFQGIVSVFLILMVLLQFGKGAEAGLLSGGASDAVFSGSQKGNILSKITTVLAVLFLANSILLAKMQSGRSEKSILDKTSGTPITKELPVKKEAAPTEKPVPPTPVQK